MCLFIFSSSVCCVFGNYNASGLVDLVMYVRRCRIKIINLDHISSVLRLY